MLWLPMACLTVAAATIGPVPLEPSLTLYLPVTSPRTLRVVIRQDSPREPERLVVRLLDPAGEHTYWRYLEYVPTSELDDARPPEIELRDLATAPTAKEVIFASSFTLTTPGVHQLRLLGGARTSSAEIQLDGGGYGLGFQNGDYRLWPGAPDTFHVYLPPRAEWIAFTGATPAVDRATPISRGGRMEIPVTATDTIWTVHPDPVKPFRATGFPFLLCDSPASAEAIHASVEVLPDGTVVCHPWQRDIAELLPDLLRHAGTADELVRPLAERRDAWLAEPLRSVILKDSWLATVDHWLRKQNVDPDSHWGGSMDGWQPFIDRAAPDHRWDRLHAISGLYAGASNASGQAAAHLALAATYDAPTNPYFGLSELLNRAAAASLLDLMTLSEDETFPGINDLDSYPGITAFAVAQKTFPAFEVAAPHLPPEVQRVWARALRPIVDRTIADYLTSARNQSSHYLVAFQAYANGTGDPLYHALAKVFARRWIRGQSAAGYHMEATGPCASYLGMTHWHEAVYYRQSGDPEILDSLRRSYRLFNHTVAPEPDGRLLGGFNFNHRVGEGFYGEQWGGARGILHDVLPEVGLWSDSPGEAERTAAATAVERFLAAPTLPPYPDITTPRYLHFGEPNREGTWPALSPESFLRNFADEFVAVKRPAYYTVIFVGKPAAADFYIRGRQAFRKPFADELETSGGDLPDVRKVTPFGGGGLSGFWTPAFGHALLAANWSPTTHHGMLAVGADGLRYWEDYFGHTFTLDVAAGTLVIEGKIEQQPLTYRRTYRFGDEALSVELDLTAGTAVSLRDLVEVIPLARGEWKARGSDQALEGEPARAATLSDNDGAGVRFTFAAPATVRSIPDGLKAGGWRKLQIGRFEVELPRNWAAGQTHRLAYTMAPL